jgi:hypothetical protein
LILSATARIEEHEMQPNMNDIYAQAEIGYRQERVRHDFQAAQRSGLGRLAHRLQRRNRLDVVQPYGDARA